MLSVPTSRLFYWLYFCQHTNQDLNSSVSSLWQLLQHLNRSQSATQFALPVSHLFFTDSGCRDETMRKQKDKQKDNHYLPCCRLFTTNAEIHQIGAVSPGLHCSMPELSVWINIRAEFVLFTTVFLQHLRHPHTYTRACGGLQDELH